MTDHPITPPPELVRQWAQVNGEKDLERFWAHIATQAARWGADQELEACCEWLDFYAAASEARDLRVARRPKPPSLKEQALIELGDVYNRDKIDDVTYDTIRLALEQLDD